MILVGSPYDPVREALQRENKSEERSNRAIFLDRDGVLNHDFGFVGRKDRFRFIMGSRKLVSWASRHGFRVILVTNQSGIGRGYFDLEDFVDLMHWVSAEVERYNGRISACYFSTSDPSETISKTIEAFQRKPNPEMIEAAILDFNLTVEECLLVGDRGSDIEAGIQAGIQNVFLFSSKPHNQEFVTLSTQRVENHKTLMSKLAARHTCDNFCLP